MRRTVNTADAEIRELRAQVAELKLRIELPVDASLNEWADAVPLARELAALGEGAGASLRVLRAACTLVSEQCDSALRAEANGTAKPHLVVI